MLKYLKPRFFSQFKEGGLIVGRFTVSNSGGTLTPVTDSVPGSPDSHPLLSVTGSMGQYVVTLLGGARQITLVNAYQTLPDKDDPTDARHVFLNSEDGINAGNGTIPLTSVAVETTIDTSSDQSETFPVISALVDTSELVVCLYVSK